MSAGGKDNIETPAPACFVVLSSSSTEKLRLPSARRELSNLPFELVSKATTPVVNALTGSMTRCNRPLAAQSEEEQRKTAHGKSLSENEHTNIPIYHFQSPIGPSEQTSHHFNRKNEQHKHQQTTPEHARTLTIKMQGVPGSQTGTEPPHVCQLSRVGGIVCTRHTTFRSR